MKQVMIGVALLAASIFLFIVTAAETSGASRKALSRRLEAVHAAASANRLHRPVAPRLSTPSSQYGNLTLVADGFTWAENVFFDNKGAMYVSESYRGIIYRFTRSSSNASDFIMEEWLSGFSRCLGFALTQDGTEMFAVAWSSSDVYNIIVFSIEQPNNFRYVSTTPHSGNGLGLDAVTNVLYTTTEADFTPNEGAIYSFQVNGISLNTTANATCDVFQGQLDNADGLWIDADTHIMYVTDVINATIRRYNLTAVPEGGAEKAYLGQYHAPGATMVDDLSVTAKYCTSGTPTLFAADFWSGNIVSFNADGSGDGTILVSGLFNPTSVRPGRGSGFDDGRTLYITEGGGVLPWTTDRRVWQLTLNDGFVC